MRRVYGQSQLTTCPFCTFRAYSKNSQGVPVCKNHTSYTLPVMKCSCGSILEMKESKFGPFFICDMCGTISMKKALSMNIV